MKALLLLVACGAAFAAAAQQPPAAEASDEAAFSAFLDELRTAAVARGIRAETLDAVLPAVRIHRRAVQADRAQAEFVETYDTYITRRLTPQRIEQGRAVLAEHGEMIRRVAAD